MSTENPFDELLGEVFNARINDQITNGWPKRPDGKSVMENMIKRVKVIIKISETEYGRASSIFYALIGLTNIKREHVAIFEGIRVYDHKTQKERTCKERMIEVINEYV